MPRKKKVLKPVMLANRWVSRWVTFLSPIRTLFVLISCLVTVTLAFAMAFWLRFEFSFPDEELQSFWLALPAVLIVKLVYFYAFRIYGGLWRYVSVSDLTRLFWANALSSLTLMLAVGVWHREYFAGLSRSVLALDFLICFFAMSGKRVALRVLREMADGSRDKFLTTLIVGSPDAAYNLIQAFSFSSGGRDIAGLLCDGVEPGRSIRGVRVLGDTDRAAHFAKKLKASEILLLPPCTAPNNIRRIIEELEAEDINCALRMVPAYTDVADGSVNVSHIKEVEIEDLLGRKPVKLDNSSVSAFVRGKRVLVTGAGGSIGSELCRQIAAYRPDVLVLFELSEFNIYSVSMELKRQYPELNLVSRVGDIRDGDDFLRALKTHRVEIVYHAAAFKHVPLMEENPAMAFRTNALGTATVADCCEAAGVRRMVMISSDKAVGPTSVMGATKRLAERLILERPVANTEFVAVRFGNVLGSSGSVIPLFKQQIKEGGPVTVTSENVTRFFMSIPEAVDLVLQAGAVGRDRDILVLEMGEPVKILDMARKLIELSGLRPDEDIQIKIVGMRPGEKEYEELLTAEEKVDKTSFDRIFVARKTETAASPVNLGVIRELAEKEDIAGLRKLLKDTIPDHHLE